MFKYNKQYIGAYISMIIRSVMLNFMTDNFDIITADLWRQI